MKIKDAERIIRQLYREYLDDGEDCLAMLFYQYLKREHPDVLKFKSSTKDKYQDVSAFIADLIPQWL